MKKTLQDKQAESSRLLRSYKAAVRQDLKTALEQEPRLKSFWKAVKRCSDPRRLIIAVAESWVRLAPADVRWIALRMIQNHCDRMAVRMGRQVLDDTFPGNASAYFISRHLIFSEGGMR